MREYVKDVQRYSNYQAQEKIAEIVSRVKLDEPGARDELILTALPWVIRYCQRYTYPGIDPEDIVQAGNLGLILAAKTFDPDKGKFTTHVTWMVRRHVSEMVRREKRQLTGIEDMDSLCSVDLSDLSGQNIDQQDTIRLIQKIAAEHLDGRWNKVLLLHCQGMTYDQISHALPVQITRERVRQILNKAIQLIREKLVQQKTEFDLNKVQSRKRRPSVQDRLLIDLDKQGFKTDKIVMNNPLRIKQGKYRWTAFGEGIAQRVLSFDTVSNCVRFGFTIQVQHNEAVVCVDNRPKNDNDEENF